MALAKSINKESQEVVKIATSTAEAYTDERMKQVWNKFDILQFKLSNCLQDVYRVVERIETLSHQLRHLAAQEATKKRGMLL